MANFVACLFIASTLNYVVDIHKATRRHRTMFLRFLITANN